MDPPDNTRPIHGEETIQRVPKLQPRVKQQGAIKRLKELQKRGLIEKRVVSLTPLRIECHLTEKGVALGDVLFHVALFSIHHDEKEVYGVKYDPSKDIEGLREVFRVDF